MFLLSITKDRLRKSMHLDSRYAYTNYKYVKFCDSAVLRSRDGAVVKVLDSQLQYTLYSMWPGFNSDLVSLCTSHLVTLLQEFFSGFPPSTKVNI